jgi:hypothetical protein
VLNGDDELLVGVASILVVITLVTASGYRDSVGPPLRPPIVASSAPLCTLVGCLGRCAPTSAWGHLPAALQKNGPDCFLARGVPGGNVEELLNGLWLVTTELVHQGSTVCVRPERRDDVGVIDLGEFVTLLGEARDIIS